MMATRRQRLIFIVFPACAGWFLGRHLARTPQGRDFTERALRSAPVTAVAARFMARDLDAEWKSWRARFRFRGQP